MASEHDADDTTPNDTVGEPVGERVEDAVEQVISDVSPSETTDVDGGSETAGRSCDDALEGEGTFTA